MSARAHVPIALLASALALGAAAAACGEGDDLAKLTAAPADAGPDARLCVDGAPTAPYPPGPYELAVLGTVPPGLTFEAEGGPVRIDDHFDPCADRPRLLVVRSSAAWCGPCLWHAANTRRITEDPRFAGRLTFVDLLVADEDNAAPSPVALAAWRGAIDAPTRLARDPGYTFGPALLAPAPLPEYVFIDTRTMTIVSSMSDPDPASLASHIAIELADLDGAPRPAPAQPPLFDGVFTENEVALLRGMRLDAAPPPDPTNAYGDLPDAVALGKALFSDALLSPSGDVSCATCHDAGLGLADGAGQSTGTAKGDRNAPSVALAAHARWQFWDGRADTLWAQALGPFEDPREMASSRLFVAHQIAARHAAAYEAVFGAEHPLPVAVLDRAPVAGKPGDPAYDALSPSDKDAITRVFVNVGKAIAAFERAIRVAPNALDRYADGELDALTQPQKRALSAFFKNGCAQCHWGPRLTNDAFHALRFPTGRQDGQADSGRADGLSRLAASEFLGSSKWSDAPEAAKPVAPAAPSMLGAFKTPTLRGLPATAPYGHGGTLATLLEVAEHYGKRGLEDSDPAASGVTEAWAPNFDAHVSADLPLFLEILTAEHTLP